MAGRGKGQSSLTSRLVDDGGEMMQLCLVFKKIIIRSLNNTIAKVFPSLCDYKIEDWLLTLLKPRFLRVLQLYRMCLQLSL